MLLSLTNTLMDIFITPLSNGNIVIAALANVCAFYRPWL
jgi:hypothetical protein